MIFARERFKMSILRKINNRNIYKNSIKQSLRTFEILKKARLAKDDKAMQWCYELEMKASDEELLKYFSYAKARVVRDNDTDEEQDGSAVTPENVDDADHWLTLKDPQAVPVPDAIIDHVAVDQFYDHAAKGNHTEIIDGD